MKKVIFSTMLLLLFTACNSEKAQTANNNAVKHANAFPTASRTPNEVICVNCRAKFKVAAAMHKTSNGKIEIICPVCHHVYLKKAH